MGTMGSVEDKRIETLFATIKQELGANRGVSTYRTSGVVATTPARKMVHGTVRPTSRMSHLWDSLSMLGLSGVVYVLFLL